MKKINELKLPSSIETATQILKQHGYRQIGNNSSFGRVFHKKGENSILKLFTKMDVPYTEFVSLAVQHKDNPHFPRFSRQVFRIKGTDYDAVKTEILQEGNYLKKESVCKMFNILKHFFVNVGYDFNSIRVYYHDDKPYYPDEYEEIYHNWVKDNPSLVSAFEIILNAFMDRKTAAIDIRPDNLMLRGNTIVIIDPVAPISYINNRKFL